MNLPKLLELIQTQRHDFLNHLQVISGLLQLNKADRVREYIGRVSLEMAQHGKTARVIVPEVTAALLTGFNEASMSQIGLELTVESSLAECAVPGPVLGEALEHSMDCAITAMALSGTEDRRLKVIFSENGENHVCRLLFSGTPPPAGMDHFTKELASVENLLEPYGGRVNLEMAGGSMEIFLMFPRKEPQIG